MTCTGPGLTFSCTSSISHIRNDDDGCWPTQRSRDRASPSIKRLTKPQVLGAVWSCERRSEMRSEDACSAAPGWPSLICYTPASAPGNHGAPIKPEGKTSDRQVRGIAVLLSKPTRRLGVHGGINAASTCLSRSRRPAPLPRCSRNGSGRANLVRGTRGICEGKYTEKHVERPEPTFSAHSFAACCSCSSPNPTHQLFASPRRPCPCPSAAPAALAEVCHSS